MSSRRLNPKLAKLNRTYTVGELATRLAVHVNTVRQWQRDGLTPIDHSRPLLFHGADVRGFLTARNASRKRPCKPGTFYCFSCREPRPPAGEMVDYIPRTREMGNLRALCATCGKLMHRRTRRDVLSTIMPGIEVQMEEGHETLKGTPSSSANSDFEKPTAA